MPVLYMLDWNMMCHTLGKEKRGESRQQPGFKGNEKKMDVYLVKKCLQDTGFELHGCQVIWRRTIQILNPVIVVLRCYVLV